MKKQNPVPNPPTTIRFSPEDQRIITTLCKKLGGNLTSVVRQALRVLAEKEKVAA